MALLAKRSARSIRRGGLLALVLLCVTGLSHAQAVDDNAADPPSRVARLSYMSGDLAFLPTGASDWTNASINRPLTSGDRLSTSKDARAELELGGSTLRLDDQTEVGVLDLNDQLAQVELTRGTLNVTVRSLDDGQSVEIDTPTVALVIDRPGNFRLEVDADATRVSAFNGSGTVYGDNSAQRSVEAGRSYRFADSALTDVSVGSIARSDGFDAWSRSRDQRYAQSETRQYVDDDVVGYQDLDQYGSWQNNDDYGEVWYPHQVATDWAPYRDGHWAYIAPWGWTWVDDAPWGFAPYHYGRWAYTHRGWGWIPGPRGVRPIYAPALVAFAGGGRWSVGIGGSPVGWFPLGPGEVYSPWYHASHRYFTNVNLRNMRGRHGHDHRADIDARYNHYRHGTPIHDRHDRNREAPRGFTAVPGNTFAGGRHVERDRMRIDPGQLVGMSVLPRGASQLRPIERVSSRPDYRRPDRVPRGVVVRHEPPPIALNRDRPSAPNAPRAVRVLERAGSNRPASDRFRPRDPIAAGTDDTLPEPRRVPRISPRAPTLYPAPVARGERHPDDTTRSNNRDPARDRIQPWRRPRDMNEPSRMERPEAEPRDESAERRPRMRQVVPPQQPRFQPPPVSRMTIMRERPQRPTAPMNNSPPPAPRSRPPSSYRMAPPAQSPPSQPQPSRDRSQQPSKWAPNRSSRRDEQ